MTSGQVINAVKHVIEMPIVVLVKIDNHNSQSGNRFDTRQQHTFARSALPPTGLMTPPQQVCVVFAWSVICGFTLDAFKIARINSMKLQSLSLLNDSEACKFDLYSDRNDHIWILCVMLVISGIIVKIIMDNGKLNLTCARVLTNIQYGYSPVAT